MHEERDKQNRVGATEKSEAIIRTIANSATSGKNEGGTQERFMEETR